MRSRTLVRALVASTLLLAWGCDRGRQVPPDARAPEEPPRPRTDASVAPTPGPDATGVTAPSTASASASAPPAPSSPAGGPIGATGSRSARASKLIAACASLPPNTCQKDDDCAIFDLETSDQPCASTLRVGIEASKKAAFLAALLCPKRLSAGPPCVVHWVRAEDGPDPPPSSRIGVRCVRGSCLTQYFKQPPE